MYESPITLIVENVEKQLHQEKEQSEQMIYQCVNSFGVVVDKEELSKALKYDRDQYSKGYKDGVNEVLNKIAAEIEKLEKKYADKPEDPDAERAKSTMDPLKYLNNGIPHFMEELTEDDLEKSEDEQ